MDNRVCKRCGKAAVHRRRRADWEKARDNLIGMRRNRCVNCGTAKWVPLSDRRGPAWGVIVAVLAVGIGGSALALSGRNGVDREAAFHRQLVLAAKPLQANPVRPSADVVSPATGTPQPPEPRETALLRTAHAGQTSAQPEAAGVTDASSPGAEAPAAAGPAAPAVSELRALTPRWTGERMEVLIDASALPADYTLSYVASSGGYVLDIPGVWSIRPGLRRSRSFTRSNLSAYDVGLHESFLRIVLRTVEREPEPDISRDAQTLRILL